MGTNDTRYKDESWLREQYIEQGKSTSDMAEMCGVTDPTIARWMDKYGIDRRSQREAQKPDSPHTDPEWLEEQYWDKGLSLAEIAEKCNAGPPTLLKWFRRFDIPRRSPYFDRRSTPVSINITQGEFGGLPGGYIEVRSRGEPKPDGRQTYDRAYVHQLVAIAEGADPNNIFSGGEWHVHHKNGIRYDNRPSNLEVIRRSEHISRHRGEND